MAKPSTKNKTQEIDQPIPEKSASVTKLHDYMSQVGIITGTRLRESQDSRPSYSTGSIGLNMALGKMDPETGLPGLPARSITEVVGPNQSGKTMFMEHLALDVQRRNKNNYVAIICAEEVNMKRMESIGVDPDRVILLHCYHEDQDEQYRRADEALIKALYLIKNHPEIAMVGLDSIKALCCGQMLIDMNSRKEQSLTKRVVAIRAVLCNSFINNFRSYNNSGAFLFMTNQVSVQKIEGNSLDNAGRPGFSAYNPSFYQPWDIQVQSSGGYGIKHDSDFRIETNGEPWFIKDKDDKIIFHPVLHEPFQKGLITSARVFKNKNANDSGNRKITCRFDFKKHAIDRAWEVLSYAQYLDIVKLSGSWYVFDKEKDLKAQGNTNALLFLDEHPEVLADLERQIIPRREELFEFNPAKIKAEAVLR